MKNLPITQKLGQSFKNFFFCEPCFGNGVGWAGLGLGLAGLGGWAGRWGSEWVELNIAGILTFEGRIWLV